MKNIVFLFIACFSCVIHAQKKQLISNVVMDSLIKRCNNLINENKLDSAEILNSEVKSYCLKYFHDKHYYYGLVQFNYARILQLHKNIVGAEPLFMMSKELFEKADSISSRYYLQCIYLLVRIFTTTNREEIAERYLTLAKDIALKYYGLHHLEYAKSLLRFSSFYWTIGRYNQDTFMEKAHEIYVRSYGMENMETSRIKFDIGQMYILRNEFEKAEKIFIEIRDLREKLVGKKDPLYLNVLMTLAEAREGLEQNKTAEEGYREVKLLCEKYGLTNSGTYKRVNALLGSFYYENQDFRKAEYFFLREKELGLSAAGPNSKEYASSLNNLGNVYKSLGDYKLAENYYLQSIEILKKLFGNQSPHIVSKLVNLGSLYGEMNDHSKSLYNLQLALKQLENNNNAESRDYARSLINLATTYAHLNNDSLFEQAGKKAQVLIRKLIGKNNQDYASCLVILAEAQIKRQNYLKADSIYFEAREIVEEVMGKGNPTYWMLDYLMARLHILKGEFSTSEKYLIDRSYYSNLVLANSIKYLSETELKNYIQQFYEQQDGPLTYSMINKNCGDSLLSICYTNSIFYKGFLLNSDNQLHKYGAIDSILSFRKKELLDLRRRLAIQYAKPDSQQNGVSKLEESIRVIQKEIGNFIDISDLNSVTIRDLKARLNADERAIEYVKFNIVDFKNLYGDITDTIFYAALVLSPRHGRPYLVPLCSEYKLKSLLELTHSDHEVNDVLYASHDPNIRSGELLDQNPPPHGSALYDLIWKPIDSLLSGVTTVYYSPVGLLQKVAFSALPVDKKQTLGNKYTLHQMGSTKNLVKKSNSTFSKNFRFGVFGGVDYDIALPPFKDIINTMEQEIVNWTYLDGRRTTGERETFKYLIGSSNEVHSLAALLNSKKINSMVFTGSNATEENLKKLYSDSTLSPDVLHIATHGFYFPNPKTWDTLGNSNYNVFKWNNNPLLRSGIVLAGANEAWSSGKCLSNREDGIVTAYEISQLNLSNTKLVVLSACETALGDIEGTEGVYGLQRAFKMAGVKYMLLSLWKVPDQETAEFMDVFYKSWIKDEVHIHQAFAKAQKRMQKKYKDVSKWGAWVLIE